ncbi:MAG: DegT/DnrJ/EryC1/StrS family aminotransferase [Boseongicola sp.]
MKIRFVEAKRPDLKRVAELLEECEAENQWANRGPLYQKLSDTLSHHASLSKDYELVPVANGGVALECMARLQSLRAGRKLRWVASAFSFWNLGRGYFNDVTFIDCDDRGLLDLDELKAIDQSSYDGLIVTNPHGLYQDFSDYSTFAIGAGKRLLFDNASGFHSELPAWPWQAFSLHHTKPYGTGEGGLALVPKGDAEDLYSLLDYGAERHGSPYWLQNGKLSDISCAFLLDRVERASEWVPDYLEQRERIAKIASSLGFKLMSKPESNIPLMNLPVLAELEISNDAAHRAPCMTFAKFYKPLKDLPNVSGIYRRLLNIPCHPDVINLSDDQIEHDLLGCIDRKV